MSLCRCFITLLVTLILELFWDFKTINWAFCLGLLSVWVGKLLQRRIFPDLCLYSLLWPFLPDHYLFKLHSCDKTAMLKWCLLQLWSSILLTSFSISFDQTDLTFSGVEQETLFFFLEKFSTGEHGICELYRCLRIENYLKH